MTAGAVDYLVKPFSVGELAARIRAQLRSASRGNTTIRTDSLRIDLVSRQVLLDDKPVRLSTTEFELLVYLAQNRPHVLSREEILRAVWGYTHDPGTNVLEVYIGYLRRKLRTADRPAPITTVRSVGLPVRRGRRTETTVATEQLARAADGGRCCGCAGRARGDVRVRLPLDGLAAAGADRPLDSRRRAIQLKHAIAAGAVTARRNRCWRAHAATPQSQPYKNSAVLLFALVPGVGTRQQPPGAVRRGAPRLAGVRG